MSISRTHATLAVLTVGTAVALLAGCGSDSSSGPKALTAAQDAAHYDSLSGALLAAGTSRDSLKAEETEIIAGVIADGPKPSSVTVTLNGSSASWLGSFANLVDSALTDSVQVVFLWSNTNVDNFLFVSVGSDNFVQDAATNGDLNFDSLATTSGSVAVPSGTCQFTNIVHVYNPVPTYDPAQSTCTPQSATGTGTITFRHDTTATGAIQTVDFSSQTVAGVRLQFTASAPFASAVNRVRSVGGVQHFRFLH
jgi:hypothetical protein